MAWIALIRCRITVGPETLLIFRLLPSPDLSLLSSLSITTPQRHRPIILSTSNHKQVSITCHVHDKPGTSTDQCFCSHPSAPLPSAAIVSSYPARLLCVTFFFPIYPSLLPAPTRKKKPLQEQQATKLKLTINLSITVTKQPLCLSRSESTASAALVVSCSATLSRSPSSPSLPSTILSLSPPTL